MLAIQDVQLLRNPRSILMYRKRFRSIRRRIAKRVTRGAVRRL
jgi:hypothetical protein